MKKNLYASMMLAAGALAFTACSDFDNAVVEPFVDAAIEEIVAPTEDVVIPENAETAVVEVTAVVRNEGDVPLSGAEVDLYRDGEKIDNASVPTLAVGESYKAYFKVDSEAGEFKFSAKLAEVEGDVNEANDESEELTVNVLTEGIDLRVEEVVAPDTLLLNETVTALDVKVIVRNYGTEAATDAVVETKAGESTIKSTVSVASKETKEITGSFGVEAGNSYIVNAKAIVGEDEDWSADQTVVVLNEGVDVQLTEETSIPEEYVLDATGLTVEAFVKNIGGTTANNVKIEVVYTDADGEAKQEATGLTYEPSAEDATSTAFTLTNLVAGTTTVTINVYVGSDIVATKIGNVIVLEDGIDLAITDINTHTPDVNVSQESFPVQVTLKNFGNTESKKATVYVYDGDKKIGEKDVNPIASNGEDGVTVPVYVSNWVPATGKHTLYAVVETEDDVNAENNKSNKTIDVTVK